MRKLATVQFEDNLTDFVFEDSKIYIIQFTAHAPYDGCFSEPQFVAMAEGTFVNLTHDSVYKIADLEDIEKYIHKAEGNDGYYRDSMNDNFVIYDVTHGFDLDNINETFYATLAQVIENELPNVDYGFTCSKCGNYHINPEYIEYEGYRGNGGVGVFMEGALCEDCYQSGCCPHCGEYVGESDIFEYAEDYKCISCISTDLEKNEHKLILEDLTESEQSALFDNNLDNETYINYDTEQLYCITWDNFQTLGVEDLDKLGLAGIFVTPEKLESRRFNTMVANTMEPLF